MKLLIAYASKSGTTKQAAELLASMLPNHETTLADLATETPDPSGFDYVVLGSPVRFSRAHRAVRKYLKVYGKVLSFVPHTLFLCCAFAEQFEYYYERIFSAELRDSAEEGLYFGGYLDPARQRGLDKFFVRMVRNAIRESEDDEVVLPGFMPEHIRILADRLRKK